MNDKRKQNEPEFLTGLKAFIERKQNEIIYNLAQKELNLRALLPQGKELSEREDTLLSRMERTRSHIPFFYHLIYHSLHIFQHVHSLSVGCSIDNLFLT